MKDLPVYKLERSFDALPELVWRTWTEPQLFAKWYGPNVETIITEQNVKPGGSCRLEMRMGPRSMFQRLDYVEVEKPKRLVCLMASTDAQGNIIASPMMQDWPRVLRTEVKFEAHGNKTYQTLSWTPHESSEAEIACFAQAISGLDKGWASGMELLAKLLAELQG
jgi:uncharacterized protein YndB with AHSA1/START domain